jgi:hypothetical protein
MRRILTIVTLLILSVDAWPQDSIPKDSIPKDTIWTLSGEGLLNLTQTSFTQWAAGGENSLTAIGILGLSANAERKEKWTWENRVRLAYGKTKTGADVRKSEDLLELHSKYGRVISTQLKYAIFLDALTQVDKGYNYPDDSTVVSQFLAPATTVFGTGIDWVPTKWLSVLVAPVTGKATFVADTMAVDQTTYGIDQDRKTRFELGTNITAKVETPLMENVTLATSLNFFSNYLENPQNIDVIWDLLLNMKVNKFITASITTKLIYDDDILVPKTDADGNPYEGPGTQFKEILAIGFGYKF